MKVEQIYTGCLAQGAYYIESNGEAVIIDPLRETQPYVDRAEARNAKIKYVFETHFHADFVSGHLDLAKKTGASIVYGPNANPTYDVIVAEDEQVFEVGNAKIKVLHTPGHTMESTCYLLIDEEGQEKSLFSGDTLFIGDVGRPDLAVKSDLTKEELAAHLYNSLHNKIMPLSDDIIVYPGHGAGSACGKNMSKETTDTLGNQKKTNYALQSMSEEAFVKQVLDGILPPPQYFSKNALLNKEGYGEFDQILKKGAEALRIEDFESIVYNEGALILDTRKADEFRQGFIPKSIFIGIDGGFAPWVGALITDIQQPIVFIAEEGREEEVVTRLARVGYDNVLGFLKGGTKSWEEAGKELDTIVSISAEELAIKYKEEKDAITILDVRKPSEYLSEHIVDVENFPLDFINDNMEKLDTETEYHVHCAGGYRSMIANSILRARGIQNLVDVAGGFKAIVETKIDKTDYVCPSTL